MQARKTSQIPHIITSLAVIRRGKASTPTSESQPPLLVTSDICHLRYILTKLPLRHNYVDSYTYKSVAIHLIKINIHTPTLFLVVLFVLVTRKRPHFRTLFILIFRWRKLA